MDLSLTDAWTLWWSGRQLTDHTLYGVSVLWLGRLGKFLAFLAGATLVLDLIGPERLKDWSRRTGQGPRFRKGFEIFTLSLVVVAAAIGQITVLLSGPSGPSLPGVLTGLCALVLAWLLGRNIDRIAGWAGDALARRGVEAWVRGVALPLFLLGFALDYLAS
jgi:hypothetical protein